MPIGISNFYIQDILSSVDKNFLNVLSCDRLPLKKLKELESIIINLSKEDEKGTHFVALKKKNNKLYYFDPLNFFFQNEYIDKYIASHNMETIRNETQIQDFTSDYCGFFCMGFVLALNNGTMKSFIDLFFKAQRKLSENDDKVISYIKNNINKEIHKLKAVRFNT